MMLVSSFANGCRMVKEIKTEGEAVCWHKVGGYASTGVMMYGSPYANSIKVIVVLCFHFVLSLLITKNVI